MALLNLKATSQAGKAGPKEPGSLTRRWSRLNRLPGTADSRRRREAPLLLGSLGLVGGGSGSSHSDCQGGGRRADTKRGSFAPPPSPAHPGAPLREKGSAPWRRDFPRDGFHLLGWELSVLSRGWSPWGCCVIPALPPGRLGPPGASRLL